MEDLIAIGIDKMDTLPGKIVVKESTEPFSATDPDRDLKVAGSTGIICCTADGEPIYRTSFYDATGTQEDTLIAHANGDAIREANASATQAAPAAKEEVEQDEEFSEEEEVEDGVEDSFEL